MGVVGAALRGFGKALKKKSKSNWVKDKAGTIKGVKPMSGKVPWWITGAGCKESWKKSRYIVKTHFSNVRSKKIEDCSKSS